MPLYAYKGVTNSGKSTRGTLSADSLRGARARMRSEGVILTEIGETRAQEHTPASSGERSRFRIELPTLRRIPPLELALATRQLSTLVGAGIPLVEALGALAEQVEHPRLRGVISEIRERVNEGASLGDSMSQAGVFSELYVSMVRAGEAGGALEVVLARLADYLEDQVRLSNKVTSILIYPAMMLGFAGIVVGVMVTVVLPQISEMLLALDRPMPFYTVWIMESAAFARAWWWAIFTVAGLAALGVRQGIQTPGGREVYDRVRLRLPVMGRVSRLVSISRVTRTLSTLIAGGVPIVQALEIARHVAANSVLAGALEQAKISIIEGASVAAPLKESGEFPPLVTTMIEVGERSGALEEMLAKVAEAYDEQVETTVTRLTALLEPLLILIMVGIVLVIILAVLVPMLDITSSIA